MKSKAIGLALLAFALGAQADVVSSSQAASVARAWVRSGSVLGVRFAKEARVTSVQTVSVTPSAALHAVGFEKGGVVFVAGDTADDPIMAFTAATPAKDSPLWDILKRDAYLRSLVRQQSTSTPVTPRVAIQTEAASRTWSSLLGRSCGVASVSGTIGVENSILESGASEVISDLRVEPLLKSRWSQSSIVSDDGKYSVKCYNYYTPDGVPCGCGATAAAQIAYYHQFPEVLPELVTKTCRVDGVSQELTVIANETEEEPTTPKPYDWSKMVPVPTVDTPLESLEAIGHLTYDVAVLLSSSFTQSSTDTQPYEVAGMFKAMGYATACGYWDERSYQYHSYALNDDSELRSRLIFSNLDAKLPVQLAIYGYAKSNGRLTQQWGGHAVVADGYGFATVDGVKTPYVHVNLGWAGSDDAWYNLPEIDTSKVGASMTDASGYDFQFLGGVVFNITTNEAVAGKELLTGRLTDGAGQAYRAATVTATDEDGNETTARPDERGVYCLWVEGDKRYVVSALSDDGLLLGASDQPFFVNKTVLDDRSVVSYKTVAGNYWGADIVIAEPSVRIGGSFYSTLDQALAAVRDGDRIEILRPTTLSRPTTLGAGSYEIVAALDDAFSAAVTCLDGAQLTLDAGASVFLTNVVFRSEPAATVVRVLDGGRASVAGVAVFDDLCSGAYGIVTESISGFVLAGELKNGITLRCLATEGVGEFGCYACDTEVAKACAARIISLDGSCRAGTWASELVPGAGQLKWADGVAVDREVAVASATVGSAAPEYYRTLDQLLADHQTGDVRIEFLRARADLGVPIEVTRRRLVLSSSSAEGTTVRADVRYAGFLVGDGGEVTVGDVEFTGAVDTTFIRIAGDGSFTMEAGAKISGLACKFSLPDKKTYGPIAVTGGTLTMREGSEISGCSAAGTSGKAKWGGAVYLGGTGCTLELFGGKISNCRATEYGGGVYAGGASTVKLAGTPTVAGNLAGASKSDLYFASDEGKLVVVDALTGGTVGVLRKAEGNGLGEKFADVAADVVDVVGSFVNDVDDSLAAEVSQQTLVWAAKPSGPQPLPESERERAVAAVKTGDDTLYYASFEDAVASLTGSADILILTNATYSADLEIVHPVNLLSEGETAWTLQRAGDVSITVGAGASLSISNLCICGNVKAVTTKVLVAVNGGSLDLKAGAKLADVSGDGNRACGAVKVWNAGSLVMSSGSVVSNCWNYYQNPSDAAGCGGGIVIDNATARLRGGEIVDCLAYSGAGLCAANGSTVYVSGDARIVRNENLEGEVCNLTMEDSSFLVLDGVFTGSIGYSEGVRPTNLAVFGSVTNGFAGTVAELTESAHRFSRDADGDLGVVVSGSDGKFLVWSDCVDPTGRYALGEKTYDLVTGEPIQIPKPSAVDDLAYDGSEQLGVLPAHGFTLTGNAGTDAGDYEASAVLKAGFVWLLDDGSTSTDDAVIPWRIAKADYDLASVSFASRKVTYDGAEHSLDLVGKLPDGLEVSYVGNPQTLAGEYEIIARFTVDANHNPVDDMTATLSVAKATYDMGHVVFDDVDYAADGTKKSIFVRGELPTGVSVAYENNEQSEPGVYNVTAKFTGDARNYESIPSMAAVMTIYESEIPKGDDPQPVPPSPDPFAIASIKALPDSSWEIKISPTVKGCVYTLQASDDLQTWTDIGAGTVAGDDGFVTFTPTSTEARRFWQAVGKSAASE